MPRMVLTHAVVDIERWLDTQLHFDQACEDRVVGAILRNLSILLGQPFEDVRALNRYRKSLGAAPISASASLA